jgi:putative transposase
MISVLRSLLLTLHTLACSRARVQLEVLALRHQLEVLQRTRPRRVRLAKADRWLWVMLSRFTATIVRPRKLTTRRLPRCWRRPA